MNQGHPPKDAELTDMIYSLVQAPNADSDGNLHWIKSCAAFIDAFIVFDEAHALADSYDEAKESHFVVHCWILSALSIVPLFLFFLSTAGKVTQFGQPHGQDKSSCINVSELISPHPFVSVGFDQLSHCHKFQQGQTIQEVTLLHFTSHLRRPLYVTSCYVSEYWC